MNEGPSDPHLPLDYEVITPVSRQYEWRFALVVIAWVCAGRLLDWLVMDVLDR